MRLYRVPTVAPTPTAEPYEALLPDLVQLVDKPLGYAHWAFPWGEGELAQSDGPDTWQEDVLLDLEAQLRETETAVRLGVASGHGVGKGALTAMIVKWFHDTRPHGRGIVTANTADQLSTKTWAEVAKWHNLSRTRHLSHWQATKLSNLLAPETWFISALPWSKDRPEAFAGLHAPYVLVVCDEASAIHDTIWDTLEGAMTTVRAIWLTFGNPTRNTGRFKEIFPGGLYAHEWRTRRIDSRTAKMANQAQIQSWIASRGIDSDFVKIRVLGEHPSQSEEQFIGEDLVRAAQQREQTPYLHMPKVLGVDVATTGRTVLILRQGCKILWDQWFLNKGVEEVAAIVSSFMDKEQPDATFVDSVGVGAGVYGLLRHTNHRVIAANGAHAVPEVPEAPGELPANQIYWNMRACMYGRMREWLRTVGCLPLRAQVPAEYEAQYLGLGKELQQPFWHYAVRGGYTLVVIESKDDMKERGIGSPDESDSLSLTFYAPVRVQHGPLAGGGRQQYATAAASPLANRHNRQPQHASGGWGGRR
jgi:hypothetical protein